MLSSRRQQATSRRCCFTNGAARKPQRFFFQAEDGIRDRTVTGVQTCALPISFGQPVRRRAEREADGGGSGSGRSEERRVGKECRKRLPRLPQKRNQPNLRTIQ